MIYEVPASAEVLLASCTTKSDWYAALGRLEIHKAPQLDAEDSIRFWASKLHTINHPAAKFFWGNFHAEYNEFDDPDVCFVRNELARSFLEQLRALGKQFFVDLFSHDGPFGVGQSWLYDPLLGFLTQLCERGGAAIILTEK
jgi:hypothetical protein